jgi:hypothetical protein
MVLVSYKLVKECRTLKTTNQWFSLLHTRQL